MKTAILIPCYNHGDYVGEAVESALAQTRRADEIVVLDDGSSDNSVAVLEGFGDRIRLRTQANAGIGATYNHLVNSSTADVVAILESDDRLEANYLERCIRFMEDHDVPWVSTARELINSSGQPMGKTIGKRSPGARFTTEDYLLRDVGRAYTPVACRSTLLGVGGYATDYGIAMDVEVALRFSTRHAMGYLEEPLYQYRIHDTNVSSDLLVASTEILEILRLFQQSDWAQRNRAVARKALARRVSALASLRLKVDPDMSRSEALNMFAESFHLDPWSFRNIRRYLVTRFLGRGSVPSVSPG